MSREDRIVELKQRMVAKYGSCLLPIAEDTATFPDIRKDDTPEEREIKLQKKRDIIAAREAAYKQKVPEMMIELEKLIDRVKSARPELLKTGMESVYSTGTAALTVFNLMCDQCGNRDPNFVVTDNKRGDRICLGKDGRGCGAVVQDHIEVQGADRRNFEGEDDRRQFGPAPNKLLGDAANMETSLNIEVRGTGRDNAPWKRISQAHQNVEMSLSSVGKDEKHTREGYKTSHKRKAFAQLEVIASDMNIHMQVVQKAKEEFAKYREVREALHNFEGVLLACLALAFEELSPHLQFMNEKPKFTTIAESDPADQSFGHIRPRSEVSDDVAISSVPAVAMGKFSVQQVREWLVSVAYSGTSGASGSDGSAGMGSYETEALIVYDYIVQLTNVSTNTTTTAGTTSTTNNTTATTTTTTNKRDLPTSSIFGTVTVSSRLKKYGNKGTAGATTTSSTSTNGEVRAGQHLLRVNNIAAALQSHTNNTTNITTNTTTTTSRTTTPTHCKAAETLFREAVIRRSQYDAALLEYERVTTLQNTRMRIEDQVSTNFQVSVLQRGKPAASTIGASVKVEGGVSHSNSSTSNGSSNSGGEKRTLDETVESNKRIKTEPTTTNTTTTSTTTPSTSTNSTTATTDNQFEDLDFDLEELVGGPVASVSSSRYTNVKTSVNGGPNHGTALKSAVNKISVGGVNVSVPKVKVEGDSSAGHSSGVNGNGSNSSNTSGSGTGEAKKVGMRPRPKFVIS